ncbi:MAG: GAF domain-containing protein, partial [bacterium]|nr:GAF domain-containing protein [bacterium]
YLMYPGNDGEMSQKIQRLIETIDVANVLTDPLTRAVEDLLRVTAADIDSDEASVLVRDGDEGDLRFLSAIGKVAEQLIDIKVPAGKGIAGFVLSSGQPIAVSNVVEDSTFYAEIDKATGYSTEMILATPLRHDGETIGVLEYINRRGDPPYTPFTPDEMDRAGRFADAIASLVYAYESAKLLRDLGDKIVEDKDGYDIDEIRSWLAEFRGGAEHREMMDLAVMVREIAGRGESERQMCRAMLEAVMRYTDSQTEGSFLQSE